MHQNQVYYLKQIIWGKFFYNCKPFLETKRTRYSFNWEKFAGFTGGKRNKSFVQSTRLHFIVAIFPVQASK